MFQTCAKFFLAETKAQCDEDDGRILLGNNIGCGAAGLRPKKYHCAEVFMSAALPRYIQIQLTKCDLRKVRLAPELSERNYCVGRGVSEQESC